jgi:exopolyphosphatase/guanosine-5'-triphosphate,3'-diphosphate pyrophosphatase
MSGQKTVAVVEVGSTGIRLVVAAVENTGEFRILDHAGKPVQLGRDVFVSGSVSRGSMMEVIAVLGASANSCGPTGSSPRMRGS